MPTSATCYRSTPPKPSQHNQSTVNVQGKSRLPLLTRRELEIVTLILKGHSNLSLAAVLELSMNTVKVHRRQIYSKLNISSQAELFRVFLA